jgi:hypothetical protein
LLIARTVEPKKQRLLGNGCVTRNNGVTVGSGVMCAVRAEAILRESLEEVGVRWPPVYEDVRPGSEERPLLEDVTQKRSKDRD